MANTKITSNVIADNAITTAAIADDAITSAKLDTNIAIGGTLDVSGAITTDGLTTSADINFGDSDKAIFGAGSDLQIYHDGTNSWIQDAGTGILALKTDGVGISMLTSTGDTLFQANKDSNVKLYYDNAQKLATTATGIDVTGTTETDNLTINGSQGTDGQVLTSTGSGVAWEAAAGAATVSTTAPSSPSESDMWFNSSTSTVSNIEGKAMAVYSGTSWVQMSPRFSATGGTITNSGLYTIHTFTSSGTFTPTKAGTVEYLVIAGGGGGGEGYYGSGGGAGGFRTASGFAVTAGAKTVTIGAGGAGATSQNSLGANGANSVFSSITSIGGGGGASRTYTSTGGVGGSGGGTNYNTTPGSAGGAGTSGQGYAGGGGGSGKYGSGGGGAGGAGTDGGGSGGYGTVGGLALASSITGTSTYYAGGGGGGNTSNATQPQPSGQGGGGVGGTTTGGNGTANTGGGGGGGGNDAADGGAGGSGVVIIRYLT